jgi:ATP-dependent Clp protease, protease subunit
MNDDYALFNGVLDGASMDRLFQYFAKATKKLDTHIHVLFQSDGGGVGNGVTLYNLFKALPVEMTIYNTGSIFSAALIAYLGARHRKTSAVATFSVHRTTDTLQFGRAPQFRAVADNLEINDRVTEAILRKHVTFSAAQWERLNSQGDLFLSGNEAVTCGVADEIGDFSPPAGVQLTTI